MLIAYHKEDLYKKMLEKHINLEEEILFAIANKDFEKTTVLIEQLKSLRAANIKQLKLKEKVIPDITIDNFYQFPNSSLYSNLIKEYQDFYKEIEGLINLIKKDKVPNLDLLQIIKFINTFEPFLKSDKQIELDNEQLIGKSVILCSESEKMQLVLKNGDKIILSLNNYDLSSFTYDQLIEILRVLDVMVSDDRYDLLRTEISKEIASISSISKISLNNEK